MTLVRLRLLGSQQVLAQSSRLDGRGILKEGEERKK